MTAIRTTSPWSKTINRQQETPITTTPSNSRSSDKQNLDRLIKSFSQAATRTHDKGNKAAAAGLAEGMFHLIDKKNNLRER